MGKMHEIVTRDEAVARGLSYYWSETPCKRAGHVGLRRIKTYECYECSKQRARCDYKARPVYHKQRRDKFAKNNPTYFIDYHKNNPDVQKRAQRKWCRAHPERCVAQARRYQKKHAAKIRVRMRNRRRNDVAYAIRMNLSSRLSMLLSRKKSKKSASTVKLIGCTLQHLLAHLEYQFKPGMSWSNYGLGPDKWHIDHIVPCAMFDLTDPGQQRDCFHYSNLQPLWQSDNLRKGAKLRDPCQDNPPAPSASTSATACWSTRCTRRRAPTARASRSFPVSAG
jgi:hypothetical protein